MHGAKYIDVERYVLEYRIERSEIRNFKSILKKNK